MQELVPRFICHQAGGESEKIKTDIPKNEKKSYKILNQYPFLYLVDVQVIVHHRLPSVP